MNQELPFKAGFLKKNRFALQPGNSAETAADLRLSEQVLLVYGNPDHVVQTCYIKEIYFLTGLPILN